MLRQAPLVGASLVGVALLLGSCVAALAQQRVEIEGELQRLRDSVADAATRGARGCAPKELAYAEATVEFAEQTLAADQLERAAAHIDEGEGWIEQARQRIEASPESCTSP